MFITKSPNLDEREQYVHRPLNNESYPYLGRIADTGKNPIQVISQMHSMKLHYGFNGKVMGAGIRELNAAIACIEIGICAITISEKFFSEFVQDCEFTLLALEKFSDDWSKSIFCKTGFSFNIPPDKG